MSHACVAGLCVLFQGWVCATITASSQAQLNSCTRINLQLHVLVVRLFCVRLRLGGRQRACGKQVAGPAVPLLRAAQEGVEFLQHRIAGPSSLK